jgi:AcrR family transcriptional regulator
MTIMSEEGPARLKSPGGLRERKKARTRASIREHALRLFREQGYHATTVEQIAEAAEVSPSTFFRYFPTKEDVVIQDDVDVIAIEAFERQPAGLSPIAAFRAAWAETYAALTDEEVARLEETAAMTMAIPELRARSVDELSRTIDVLAQALARRTGRDPGDFAVRNLVGAMIGVILSATMPWAEGAHHTADTFARVDAALAHLEAGLPL